MKQTLDYNVHDALTFRINRDRRFNFKHLFNLKYSSFQVESVSKPDIIFNIGRFTPSNSNCYVVDHKYYIKENYFYCKDSDGKSSWEVEITGLEQGNTTVNFNVARRLQPQPINLIYVPLFLPQAFLLRIIERKLGAKGYFLAHAGAVAEGDQAYLLCGRAGCFKTTLCMEFVRRAGFTWLGDDQVILCENEVLGFPMNPAMFEFMTKHLPDETHWSLLRQLQLATECLLGKHQKASEHKPESAKLKAVLLIARASRLSGGKKVIFSPVPQSQLGQVMDSLDISNKLEDFQGLAGFGINSAPLWRYLLAYSFVFPDSQIAMQEVKLAKSLRNTLENIPVYKVDIPPDYTPGTFEQIHQLLNELGG